ncbi:LysR substrate-binding domain-containing protein [Vibrio sp. 10N.261.51.F12]|uniref:LysR family transcriptional regulator n=1 Tax=Vibrio sp. 10N.261.51.F12 TaxID=3229679 RepID=UPI00354F3477
MQHKKIERLMLYSEVAKQRSFTKAAETLEMSKGYLSTQIKQLEKDLGYTLMIRSTRSLRLTPQGERVLAGMESIQMTLLDLERQADYENEALEGIIRITAPLQFTQSKLTDLCARFNERHPQVQFEIECSYQSHDLVKDNFDVAFRATQAPPENMVARKLFSYKKIVTATTGYLSMHEPLIHPNQLINHNCLTGNSITEWGFKQGRYPIKGWLFTQENTVLKSLALEGKGLIYTPDYFVAKEVDAGTLQPVLSAHTDIENDMYLLYPSLVSRSKRLSTFIEFVQHRLKR